MPADTPITFAAGPLATGDLNAGRNLLRYMGGFVAGSKPFARVRNSTAVSLPLSADWNDLSFDTVVYNRGESLLYAGGAPSLFTVPSTGFYFFGACVRTEATTANKALRITSAAQGTLVQHDNIGVSVPAFTTMNVMSCARLAAADTIKPQVYQDAGATITAIVEGVASPVFWCSWYAIDDD